MPQIRFSEQAPSLSFTTWTHAVHRGRSSKEGLVMARPRPLAEQCLRSIVFCFLPKRELPSLPQPIQRVIIRGFTHPPRSNKSHNDPVHQQVGSFASDSGPPWLDRLRTLTDIWCALAKQAATYPRRTHNCPGKAKDTRGVWPADAEFSGHPATQASFRAPPFIHFLRFRRSITSSTAIGVSS